VAVGDIASTSQLPSPHGGQTASATQQQTGTPPPPPVFTAADFIRSVNKKVSALGTPERSLDEKLYNQDAIKKDSFSRTEELNKCWKSLDRSWGWKRMYILLNWQKYQTYFIKREITRNTGGFRVHCIVLIILCFKVRQNYIRRRLLTTYKALERLSQSEFNLDRLEVTPSAATASVNTECAQNASPNSGPVRLTVPGSSPSAKANPPPPNSTNAAVLRAAKQRASKNLPLTIRDVERERGKPLSKYERNMMIFNWLHTLDDTVFVEGIQ
jgi:hypothetical protein